MTDEEINEKARAIICAALRTMIREVESSSDVIEESDGIIRRGLFPVMVQIATLIGFDIRGRVNDLTSVEMTGIQQMAEMQEGEKKGRN